MSQHRLASHVANCEDRFIGRPPLLIDAYKAFLIQLDLRLFQTESAGIGTPADGDQDTVESHFLFAWFRAVRLRVTAQQGDTDAFGGFGNLGDLRIEKDLLEERFEACLQRSNQVPVHPRQQAVDHFHDGHFAAQCRIDVAQLQTDVPSAHDEQTGRNFLQPKSGRGVHNPRTFNFERRWNRRAGADRDNAVLEAPARSVVQL